MVIKGKRKPSLWRSVNSMSYLVAIILSRGTLMMHQIWKPRLHQSKGVSKTVRTHTHTSSTSKSKYRIKLSDTLLARPHERVDVSTQRSHDYALNSVFRIPNLTMLWRLLSTLDCKYALWSLQTPTRARVYVLFAGNFVTKLRSCGF